MKTIALASLLLAAVGCKSSEKSGTAPSPEQKASAPAPAEAAAKPEVKDEAPPEPEGTLKVGVTVRKAWDEGGPGQVVWKLNGGGEVMLTAEAGEPEGVLSATHKGKKQQVTKFPCDTARGGSDAAFAVNPEGKVLFRAAVGPAGKDPGAATVFLLEWQTDKEKVSVAKTWNGTDVEDPPAWAKL